MAGRVMGLDPGEKRMGVALSDELGLTAQPLETYSCQSVGADVAFIRGLVERHAVRQVVVGMPVQLNGASGPASERVQRFIERLQQELSVPVLAWDERLTSKAAERMLIEADVSRKKRKGAVDRVAAALMLQGYLDQLAWGKDCVVSNDPEEWHSASDQEAAGPTS